MKKRVLEASPALAVKKRVWEKKMNSLSTQRTRAMAPHFAEVGLKYEITDFSAPDGKCEEVISKIK